MTGAVTNALNPEGLSNSESKSTLAADRESSQRMDVLEPARGTLVNSLSTKSFSGCDNDESADSSFNLSLGDFDFSTISNSVSALSNLQSR